MELNLKKQMQKVYENLTTIANHNNGIILCYAEIARVYLETLMPYVKGEKELTSPSETIDAIVLGNENLSKLDKFTKETLEIICNYRKKGLVNKPKSFLTPEEIIIRHKTGECYYYNKGYKTRGFQH